MHPAYFALAMATGIVAIACHLLGLGEFAVALARINLVAYPTLWVLFIARAVMFRERVIADWGDHARGPGYFTVVAATGVLGTQAVLLHDEILVAKILWWVCVALWAMCTYTVFALLTVREEKPTLAEGINGGWLLAVVATQSVSVLGLTLDGAVLGDRDTMLFVLMSFWLGGGMLYFWIIGLIFYRYMFFRFSPTDAAPPYWINMGAVAISTLAGALLANAAESSTLLAPLRPFILGLTMMFWATATWWIPLVLILGIWRHRVRRVPFSYDPLYWGLVFPIGMYSVCTFRLAEALDAPFLMSIARPFVIAAVAVWLLTFLGLTKQILYAVLLGLRRPHISHVEQPGGQTAVGEWKKIRGITQ
jgi:tellurite resistance protein TehA-like permease